MTKTRKKEVKMFEVEEENSKKSRKMGKNGFINNRNRNRNWPEIN